MSNSHKAGFVSIIGKPNAGKSTLMNKLVGENLSIITSKAQTTRHRIMGILSGKDFQIVYSDTPGLLEPKYELQKGMMRYVKVSLEDADLILLVVELGEKYDRKLFDRFSHAKAPVFLIINKIDLTKGSQLEDKISYWKNLLTTREIIPVSALTGEGVDKILRAIIINLPHHPAYYPKDEFTDKNEKFFASEIIREKIFLNYDQEIPYSTEVTIESFREEKKILRMRALIFVERDSQKGILIGKAGSALKKIGIEARKDLEAFFSKKVFLETHVKVAGNWRKQRQKLRQFGYTD